MSVNNDQEFIDWITEELGKAQAEGRATNWRLSDTPIPADPFIPIEVKHVESGVAVINVETGSVDYIKPAFPDITEEDDDPKTN
jgi:hypothetical protein